jgi:hypothetical protein
MIIGVFFAWIDEAFSLGFFLGLRMVLFIVAIADRTGIVQVGPRKSQVGIPPCRYRLEVIDRHPFLTAESIVRRQAVRAPAAKQRTEIWFVTCRIRERPRFRPTFDLHDGCRAL